MRKINRKLSQSKQYKNYEKIIFNYFTDYHRIGNVGTGHNCYAYRLLLFLLTELIRSSKVGKKLSRFFLLRI